MSKVFSFKDQLKIGNVHEQQFLKHYHSPIVKHGEFAYDFRRIIDGKRIELKSDTYDMNKTPNMFMEVWSDFEKKKPGGIWQSKEKKVDIFIYHFPKNFTYFEFNLKELIKELQKTADKYNERGGFIYVRNNGWTTAGFTISREKLRHLFVEHKYEPKREDN